jgi:ABC-type transport system involved in multi-copper enzyme maturation permease subunit
MQHNYTEDVAGPDGQVSATDPRWLRLTRSGDTLTGYASADGTNWSEVGTANLAGLPSTVQAGLFVASPGYSVITESFGGSSGSGGPTLATASFDNVDVQGTLPQGKWAGDEIGTGGEERVGTGFQQAGGGFTVSGSGDIAPVVAGRGPVAKSLADALVGGFAGLIPVIVVATMFTTSEYRRGLLRITLAASPRRGRVLAAKALVIGTAAFVTGLAAALITIPLVESVERDKGFYLYPVKLATELRVIGGTAALFAAAAVLTLAVGTMFRRSAGAVTAVIVAIVLPYVLAVASVLPAGAAQWLTRLTPAAAFAVQQSMVEYPQVTASYTPADGYFPLSPWGGFAVLCGYAAVALGAAFVLLRRRDA